jgi:aminobenzoyl-glutamate utilization protein A
MDSNEVVESSDNAHRPMAENFRSTHEGCMHACGHDGHVTIGLAVAKLIAEHKDEMAGTVKFFFQPAEEGVRGARAMVASGIVDDVEYFLSGHIGFNADQDNELVCTTGGFLATSKLDAHFTGVSSHAGAAPEQGKNALLAAAQAAISLHTISRHGAGASRINVGVINAGTGRNVLPDVGEIKMETRGANTAINEYMMKEAKRMIAAAAAMYDVKVTTKEVGGAPACELSEEMGKEIYNIAKTSGQFTQVVPFISLGASEDCSYFMDRVQHNGGQANYMMYGTKLKAGHHNMAFDFNEECLPKAVGMLVTLAKYFSNK